MTARLPEIITRWIESVLYQVYGITARADSVIPADLIFVMAGRIERKQYGLELYRAGIAPRLLLSIGRFEVSKMIMLPHADIQRLLTLRDRTPPNERHFFVTLDASGTHIDNVRLPRWNTYGEALGVREFLRGRNIHTVNVISTEVHLRRVALTFSKVFCADEIRFRYCSVPDGPASAKRQKWWTRSRDRRYVLTEVLKLAGYGILLSIPTAITRLLMRRKHHVNTLAQPSAGVDSGVNESTEQ